jgi:hypothetical protein
MRFPINVVTASVDLSVDILNIDIYEWDYFMKIIKASVDLLNILNINVDVF